jgi:acetylornithine deacetylase/succinyl-diaminopimelate desuccinylase-like protein
MSRVTQDLPRYIQSVRPKFEEMLQQLVEVPSVSSDPHREKDIRKTAKLAVQCLKRVGATAKIIETSGYPAVVGGWQVGKHYPTVMIYNHLDVQPALEPEWRQDPFTFRKVGNRYCGRGATDDKGPALTAMLAGHYAIQKGFPLNIQFLWELEEEIGSPHFSEILQKKQACPRPDSVLVSDTIWISRKHPAISCGLRGLLGSILTLRTGTTDVHSGLTGGGARNPLAELCELVQACVDARTGRVKIPGFYDDVLKPSSAEIKNFLASGFDVNRFKRAFGFRSLRTEDPLQLISRIWAAPTFEVHGLVGGHIGPGVKTVVPPSGELKVSMRLVPNQQPRKVFRQFSQFIKAKNPDVHVTCDGMLEPFQGVTTGPYADALKRAVERGFGKTPAMVREGGSIGAVSVMEKVWKVPILFMGLSLPEHGYHAPNEFFDWGQASGGMRVLVEYFSELAALGPGSAKT